MQHLFDLLPIHWIVQEVKTEILSSLLARNFIEIPLKGLRGGRSLGRLGRRDDRLVSLFGRSRGFSIGIPFPGSNLLMVKLREAWLYLLMVGAPLEGVVDTLGAGHGNHLGGAWGSHFVS